VVLSISTEENIFAKNDTSAILDCLATIEKRSTGKISKKVYHRRALALDFKGTTLLFDIIDPTILGIVEQESNELGLFEKLKATKKVGTLLDNKGLSISILREGKKSLSIGREATPKISSLLTGSDDIQIDSIMQVTKLDKDNKKANENKNENKN
jgi:hypothetical protein